MRKLAMGIGLPVFFFLAQQFFGSRPIGPMFVVGGFTSAGACYNASQALLNGELLPGDLKTSFKVGYCVDSDTGLPQS